jgi:hypothetical protein
MQPPAVTLKWSMPTPDKWELKPYERDGKGDRPADSINQSKEADDGRNRTR